AVQSRSSRVDDPVRRQQPVDHVEQPRSKAVRRVGKQLAKAVEVVGQHCGKIGIDHGELAVEPGLYAHLAQRTERQLDRFDDVAELAPQLFTNTADRRIAEQWAADLRGGIESRQLVESFVEQVVAL